MARQPDAAARRQRLVGLAAVAALSVATAFAFGRVFAGRAPTRTLLLAALASALIATALERRSLALALVASTAGLAFALTWLIFPQTAWYGLPSLRTLRAIGRSLEIVAEQARVQVAPTPPFPPLLLAALTAMWTATFSTHALAMRAGSPLLAVVPPVALVAFADTVMEDGPRPIYAIVLLVAVLLVVFVDGLRRVREWGPVWSAFRARGLGRVAGRGARAVGLVAVLAALLVPGLLPGFGAPALVDFSTSGDDGVSLDPFVSIQSQLNQGEPVDLFEVRTEGTTGAYWRLYALDRFDGLTWSSSDPEARAGAALSSDAQLNGTFPPAAPTLVQHVTVLNYDERWLPMAYPAESVDVPVGGLRYDADLGTAAVGERLEEGIRYSVTSRIVAPTPAELEQVRFGPAASYDRYTFVPASVDPRVEQVADRWTRNARTPYEQVLAIQERFQRSFVYDQDVEPVADSDALLNFLVNSRRGFCQQFATAMAVLVRELGYPARVAVGFQRGEEEGGRYVVTSKDAHAWVEVYFGPTYGWLPFEPTPSRSNPLGQPGTYLNPVAPGGTPSEGGATPNTSGIPGSSANAECASRPRQLCADPVIGDRGARGLGSDLPPGFFAPSPAPEEPGYSIPYRWIGLALAATVVLLLVLVPLGKWTIRRRRLRRSRDPRTLVLAAYSLFDARAADVGAGRRGGETVEEQRARLGATVAFRDGHLERLIATTVRAAYGGEAPTRAEAREAVRDARAASADVRRDAGALKRVLGVYRLRA